MPVNWGRQWLHFNLLLFIVVNGKGPPRVLILRLKNSFYSADISQSTERLSNQDGAAVDVALCLCLNEQNRSCREQPVLFLFYRSGGLWLQAPKFTFLVFSAENTLIPNKQLTRRTWHSWMQTCHRNDTRLLTDVLGIPFDVCKFTGIVWAIFSHLKNQPPAQLLLSWDKINGPQLVAWLAHLRMKQCPFEGTEKPGWNLVPHFEWNGQESYFV